MESQTINLRITDTLGGAELQPHPQGALGPLRGHQIFLEGVGGALA